MQVSFRQGLISYQTLPQYLIFKNTTVSLDATKNPIKITFASGITNYLYIEKTAVVDAWSGPFNTSSSYWLYWDISLTTGKRTFGHTTVAPSFGPNFPSSPKENENFFNVTDMKMYFWNGQAWVECIRVFAGSLESGKIKTNALGTQVNVNIQNVAGEIIFDINDNPLKRFINNGSFIFLTSEDVPQPAATNFDSISLRQLDISGVASGSIPIHYCVIANGTDSHGVPIVEKASYFNTIDAAYAITTTNMNAGDVRQLIHYGFIQDPTWQWNVPPLTPLFVGGDGEISLYVKNAFSVQKIGYVVNLNTIFVDFSQQIILTTTPRVATTPIPI